MLSYGKVIGNLSKITRHAHATHLHRPLKYVGFISISRKYSKDGGDSKPCNPCKPPGTTIKVGECVPGTRYPNMKRPPPPSSPACQLDPDGACPMRPASCEDDCGKSHTMQSHPTPCGDWDNENRNKQLRYWKQLLAALLITGATLYALTHIGWLEVEETGPKKTKSKKKLRLAKVKVPAESSSIPREVPYLLIGGGTAAFSAFRSIKSRDPTAKVLVVTEESDLPYMRPPLSKELWYNKDRETTEKLHFKQWNGTDRSLYYEPPEFYAKISNLVRSPKGGVAVARGWAVQKIDVVNKTAILEDGHEIKYDKCLIATGASPKNLPIFELAEDEIKNKIVPFRTKEDFLELEENIQSPEVKNIVIIGGGFLGSEIACSLVRNLDTEKKKVLQVYKEKFIMAQVLPEYLSQWATEKANAEGVNCIPGVEIEDVDLKNGQLHLVLTNGQTLEADQVIVAVGAKANTQLAGPSDLEVDPEVGGFLVNAELEARSNLWIAGDAACFYDVRLGRRRVEHHDHAVISGRLAGENMTGAGKPYLHQSMFWSDLGPEVGYEAIGIVDSSLPTVGVFAKATDEDTPLAAVTASNEVMRSVSEEKATMENQANTQVKTTLVAQKIEPEPEPIPEKVCPPVVQEEEKTDDFGKGVIFYLRDDIVVGIVLWNIFNRMSIARQVLARGTQYDDLNEVAKLFTIHED